MRLDVALIHPPAFHDFRKTPLYSGPAAQTVRPSTSQFITIPIGVLSIAEYLNRFGYRVKILNLGELMVGSKTFDAARMLKGIYANIYGIDLHWVVHSQGAIEVARLCKKYHPNSMVILGGLTATRFWGEILRAFPFIDAVVLGEGEEAVLELADKTCKGFTNPRKIGGVALRLGGGRISSPTLRRPCETLDDFSFDRLDLIDPCEIMITSASGARTPIKWWNIPACRGCLFNCVTCGGSAYSYSKLCGRGKPAFRSPSKIVEDLQNLSRYGISHVFLFQDPRMGGKRYLRSLLQTLKAQKPSMNRVTLELFYPPNEDYIKELSKLDFEVNLTMSPESGSNMVRQSHGREYTNTEIRKTLEMCNKYSILLSLFFMLCLSNENHATLEEMKALCDTVMLRSTGEQSITTPVPAIGPMLLIDPGSLAFDYPDKFGYRLLFKKFIDHYRGLTQPSWNLWISYETNNFSRKEIALNTISVLEFRVGLKERYLISKGGGDYAQARALLNAQRFELEVARIITNNTERMNSSKERINEVYSYVESTLKVLSEVDLTKPNKIRSSLRGELAEALHRATGIICEANM